eukprot:CCRYP_019758-RB/>CCRYP_019758-RB protein AED:0.33 eAED:0.51 QI:0/0.33/0.25/1/0/0/4/1581/231
MPMFESSNNFSITCLQLLLWYLLQIDPCCFELGKGLLFFSASLTSNSRIKGGTGSMIGQSFCSSTAAAFRPGPYTAQQQNLSTIQRKVPLQIVPIRFPKQTNITGPTPLPKARHLLKKAHQRTPPTDILLHTKVPQGIHRLNRCLLCLPSQFIQIKSTLVFSEIIHITVEDTFPEQSVSTRSSHLLVVLLHCFRRAPMNDSANATVATMTAVFPTRNERCESVRSEMDSAA